MSGSRMGFDLRTRRGWANLIHAARYSAYRIEWRTVFGDTFLPLICAVRGHDPYDAGDPPNYGEWACRRCHHYIATPPSPSAGEKP